ncbi:polymorphic toxin-type HINT domain-containing protein [Actinoplanes awajinensis]|uniref:Intein C-terminal splicing domain-containing protein n=1 Tax=Actinoplanes awajinensis subsp. mycoplanecinus TaxID=135947 RepID=A0A101JG28_9ACTN|nr:polymorphic toxin-type HINT domain-containing protein [Actinoplanes awajinensis]KUL25836.1 hypothetical protein ADL15_39710 [Actinoplanes awajinensis subsp. mycoplanecinus]
MNKHVARLRALMIAVLAAALIGTGLHAPPAAAAPVASPARALPALAEGPPIPVPPLVTESWNGTTGIDANAERWRKAVADVAALAAEPEVRNAALTALATGDNQKIMQFALVEKRQLETQIAARKKQTAADNLVKIKALVGTGGKYFNAEVQRVLAGTDADREDFFAYSGDIARARDDKVIQDARDRAAQLRDRLRIFAAAAPAESQLRVTAEAALAGDDTAVSAFWETGYLPAAKADAAAREQYLKDLEARTKAAEELTDLAKRAQRASQARSRLLAAHGDAVKALQLAANAMAGAANAARHAEQVITGTGTASAKAAQLAIDKSSAAAQIQAAQDAVDRARPAAATATSAANDLIDTGLTYGAEWSAIVTGMNEAVTAAQGATSTAAAAIDATIATNNAQDAQAKAEAHARQAEQWRKHAQEHAAAAAKLAAAAAKQATAAKTAAARAKTAREQAQAAERDAWAAAERTRQQRQTAEAQATIAAQQRQIAETERANAATHRAEAERQAAIASNARANAEAQAKAAADAEARASAASVAAGNADEKAWGQEKTAQQARDDAQAAERAEQTAKAKTQALRAAAAATAAGAEKDEAQRQADEADRQATAAGTAARNARSAANTATGAAANARTAATQAEYAADRATAAAQQAQAAAAAADAAADKAEASAKATHAAHLRADAKAADATTQQVKAAAAANAAQRLAGQAADESARSLWSANRVRDEAQAATTESVAAAAQSGFAVQAAIAASTSAAGIAEPANTAIGAVSPFAGSDIDADFVALVAEQAKTIGAEQAAAAKARADEAILAAQRAQDAADGATGEIKQAFNAAAQAARSAADAAQAAARAKQDAAQAAAEGAAARIAATNAARADDQARADAAGARSAADAAANDAVIAGRSAQAAQDDATAAGTAAIAAENDASAARDAAGRAESDAANARTAADEAQEYADSAAKAATNALQASIAAQRSAEAAEQAQRDRAAADFANSNGAVPTDPDLLQVLSPEEQQELQQAQTTAGMSVVDFFRENAWQLFLELSGTGDVLSCVREGNTEACLWSLASLLPIGKMAGAFADVVRLMPKLLKFLDKVKAARKKFDDLMEAALRKKKKLAICPNLPVPRSLVAGTPVLMADGTTRAIEMVKTGDEVLATNPETGIRAAKPVLATSVDFGRNELSTISIDIDGSRGTRTAAVTAADDHPFWAQDRSKWVEAGQLMPGHWLRTSAGTSVQISAIKHRTAEARLYNLTIADFHSYYAVAAGTAVLTHNASICPPHESGIEEAKKAKSYFEKKGLYADGITCSLWVQKFGFLPLASGSKNVPDVIKGKPAPGSKGGTYDSHCEAQAAALMWFWGDVEKATLYLDTDYICPVCRQFLPKMLPPGSSLMVVYTNKKGIQEENFDGPKKIPTS